MRRSPFNDYTIPRVALIRSRKAARMLDRLFGELTIEELAKPLFTVSADLVSSRLVVHRRGSVIEAVGASMSIPGSSRLCPAADACSSTAGCSTTCRSTRWPTRRRGRSSPSTSCAVSRRPTEDEPPLPSIMETLSRATVLGSVERAERNRELALLVIAPDVQDIPLRDFRSLDRAIEAGRAATRAALDAGARDEILAAVTAPVT